MKSLSSIEIALDSIKDGLCLYIDARTKNTLYDADEDAAENNEARYQLIEGCYYDYAFSEPDYFFGEIGQQIIQPHSRNRFTGIISPNIFVGTLSLPIFGAKSDEPLTSIQLEVQSVKSNYRDDYRDMLAFITEKCTDLLLQVDSPVEQYFEIDYAKDSQTLYQKFTFIKSIINSDEFVESIHRIVTTPVTKWVEVEANNDIRRTRRFSRANTNELFKGGSRTELSESHYLRNYGLTTLPKQVTTVHKKDSIDTPENRFIKHALEVFLKFCVDINNAAPKGGRLDKESLLIIKELEQQLHHSFFKDISRPTTLKLNSPVLQRKEGYREVLRVWLMFDLAAKLIWIGGDDIYSGGKKNIATLYEYWLFFKLLDLFQDIFEIESKDVSKLIEKTQDGLNLRLKQGKFIALKGVYNSVPRRLNIQFSYNRSFSGENNYPDAGSWTTTLRPDYTLSFWPLGISESEAERQELIVHIHFDAKYKVANLSGFIKQNLETELNEEKEENRKGIYKNADLLKMHAYKDAIRRTGGAYVLYPGDKSINRKGFHEIVPGLGAFPIRPSKIDTGIGEFKAFILEIVEHFINRASQREKLAFRTFDIHKTAPDTDYQMSDSLPESYNANRGLLPDETHVLIGFYKSEEHYEWIKKSNLYNFRIGSVYGALNLDVNTVGAKYLLLHTTGEEKSGSLWRIVSSGPKLISKNDLHRKGYPSPSQDYYLIIKIEPVNDVEFENVQWDFRRLSQYETGRASAIPFTASLTELMKNKISSSSA